MEYATLKSRLMKKSVKGLNGIKRIEITKTYRMTYFSSAIVYPNDFEFPNLSSRLRVTQSRNGVRCSCDLWIKGIYLKRCLLRPILETRTLFFSFGLTAPADFDLSRSAENYLYNLYFLLTTWNEKTSWDTKVTWFSCDIGVYNAYYSIFLHHMLVTCIRAQKQAI